MRQWASRTLAATLVLVGATSCGSGGSDGSTSERPAVQERGGGTTSTSDAIATVRHAVAASRAGDTVHYAGSFYFDAGELGTDDPAAGGASLDGSTAAYTVDMQAETKGLVAPGTPKSDIQLRVRDVGGQLYLQFPAAFESAGVGDQWVRIPDNSDPGGVQLPPGFEKVSARPFLAARLLRPQTCLDILQSATTARLVGPEAVRGKPTTRYALTWSPRPWVEKSGLFFFFGTDRSPERLAIIDDVLRKATIADVWLDDLGRVRRLVTSIDLTIVAPYFTPPGDPNMWRELRTRCEFYDYGTRISPVARPTDFVNQGVQK
jgi:hypothetical protein